MMLQILLKPVNGLSEKANQGQKSTNGESWAIAIFYSGFRQKPMRRMTAGTIKSRLAWNKGRAR